MPFDSYLSRGFLTSPRKMCCEFLASDQCRGHRRIRSSEKKSKIFIFHPWETRKLKELIRKKTEKQVQFFKFTVIFSSDLYLFRFLKKIYFSPVLWKTLRNDISFQVRKKMEKFWNLKKKSPVIHENIFSSKKSCCFAIRKQNRANRVLNLWNKHGRQRNFNTQLLAGQPLWGPRPL